MNPITPGTIFTLGEHRLMCGDATNAKHMKALLQQDKVDLLLTDPPYGVAYVETKAKGHKPIANDDISDEGKYADFTKAWLKPIAKQLNQKNSVYIFHVDKMLFALKEAMEHYEVQFKQLLIWVKTASVMSRMDYHPQHELIAYGWRGAHKFHRTADHSILTCPKPKKNTVHPTMKPISLLRRLILNSSARGGVVCDPFGGSGSTLLACEQTKRQCRMMELDPGYCQVIIDRWEKLSGEKAVRITDTKPA